MPTTPDVEALRASTTLVHLGSDLPHDGSETEAHQRVLRETRQWLLAAAGAGLPHLVVTSSVVAYAAARNRTQRVDESWPVSGVPGSRISRTQADVEALVDAVAPAGRVTRLRPGLVVREPQRVGAARDVMARPWVDAAQSSTESGVIRMSVQTLQVGDYVRAVARVVLSGADGAFNLSEQRPRAVVPTGRSLRAGWLDAAMQCPLMTVDRARRELGWCAAQDAPAVRTQQTRPQSVVLPADQRTPVRSR
ncbi:Rossmann-fold NAD(P)-binding domain-containing protein [Angustibacter aerolatus]